jgi:Zn-dependent peptidase ImmA (M78 family)
MHHEQANQQPSSALGSLRAIIPSHGRVAYAEALRIAERQANLLLNIQDVRSTPVPTEAISTLPKITVQYTGHLVWGASFWDLGRQTWVIQLSSAEPPTHNRFTLAHEYKHIIDHGRQALLYRGTRRTDPSAQEEQAADYFAGCLLVPRKSLKDLWHNGIQTTGELAEIFNVSEFTIGNRLRQTGLVNQDRLRHLASPLPFIAEDEDESPPTDLSDAAEGVLLNE